MAEADILLKIADEKRILEQQKSDILTDYAKRVKNIESVLFDLNQKLLAARKEFSDIESKKSEIPSMIKQAESKAKELIGDAEAKAVSMLRDAATKAEEAVNQSIADKEASDKLRAEAIVVLDKAKKELDSARQIKQDANNIKIELEYSKKIVDADMNEALKLKAENEKIKASADIILAGVLKEKEFLSSEIAVVNDIKAEVERKLSEISEKEKLLSDKENELTKALESLNKDKVNFQVECDQIRLTLQKQADANDFEKKLITAMKSRVEDEQRLVKVEMKKIEEIKKNLK